MYLDRRLQAIHLLRIPGNKQQQQKDICLRSVEGYLWWRAEASFMMCLCMSKRWNEILLLDAGTALNADED